MKIFLKLLISLLIIISMTVVYADAHASTSTDQLQSIEKKNVLRIGTTGDYPPLTIYNETTHQFSGTDIDAAKNLAHFLGANAEFIKTSWPTLSADLLTGKFDIAMGGISKNPQRAHDFLLSKLLGKTGKVPLVRCADIKRYQSIAEINQKQVRIIENKGGTNAEFARNNLPQAQLIIVDTNEETFTALITHQSQSMDNIAS